MKRRVGIIVTALVALAAAAVVAGAAIFFAYPVQVSLLAGVARSYLLTLNAPPGTVTIEENAAFTGAAAASPPPAEAARGAAIENWPSYNKTLTSERYSDLGQINTKNVEKLRVMCTYDTGQYSSFETGLIMVEDALIGTTEFDIFSLNPATCTENWRTHEVYPRSLLSVNRGAAYMDGQLFRGSQDGRVFAYDFKTGTRLWETTIADPNKGETVPAAPIAWNGLVYVGNAGGDYKGGKGRMYALEATTGKVIWEFYLVPKTGSDPVRGPQGASPLSDSTWRNLPGAPISGGGTWTSSSLDPATGLLYVPGGNPAPDFDVSVREGENLFTDSVVVLNAKTGTYTKHLKLVRRDWHDWDVSNPPALIRTRGGQKLMALAPKDGFLYGFDLSDDTLRYKVPVTKIENADVPFSREKGTHFCPGTAGGGEWNGPAYDPRNNLIFVGDVDWCTTVKVQPREDVLRTANGQRWMGMWTRNPFNALGRQDRADGHWSGWLHAVDADTGVWKWRLKSNYPIVSGVTPTAGGLVFFGDVGGNFYAVNAANGERLWGNKIGGGIAGGVITYSVNGVQKVAVTTGFISPVWPVEVTTGKVAILGVD
jgi:alcohol dehydrogenase (cytochrome c)